MLKVALRAQQESQELWGVASLGSLAIKDPM